MKLKDLLLNIKSVPSLFMNKEDNARYHLLHICPYCPKYRRNTRDINDDGDCYWFTEWSKGNYDIPKNLSLLQRLKIYYNG